MKSKWISENPKTLAVIFDAGDEVMAGLKETALKCDLAASHFTAIGAFKEVTLGFFDWETKKYKEIAFHEQMEVLSLIGDIALTNDGPQVHTHVVVGRGDATTRGGHLLHAIVRPTLEVILTESLVHLHRRHDAASGLALINLEKTS